MALRILAMAALGGLAAWYAWSRVVASGGFSLGPFHFGAPATDDLRTVLVYRLSPADPAERDRAVAALRPRPPEELDRPAEPLPDAAPAPPLELLRRRLLPGGSATLRFVVDAAGRPDARTLSVVRSTSPAYAAAAMMAAAHWRYRPAQRRAEPVAQWAERTFAC